MIIRREQAGDRPEIHALLEAVFPTLMEAKLVRELFAARQYLPLLSLVAEGGKATTNASSERGVNRPLGLG